MSTDKKRFKKFIIPGFSRLHSRQAKFGIIGLLVCILVLVAHPLWLPLPAKFLVVKDNIKKADAILIFSGDWNFGREEFGIDLHNKGYAKKLMRVLEKENVAFDVIKRLLNSEAGQEELYTKYFESRGVDKEAVILGEAVTTSTFDELKAAKDIVIKNDYKSIILVTSDYHMRRALMTAKRVFRGSNVRVYNATVYSGGFNPGRWWLHERSIRDVIFEYLSSGFYLAYHFILDK